MNRTITIESKNYEYQKTFGGLISSSDFDTDYPGTRNMAGKILSCWRFDKHCKKNYLDRKKRVLYVK